MFIKSESGKTNQNSFSEFFVIIFDLFVPFEGNESQWSKSHTIRYRCGYEGPIETNYQAIVSALAPP